MVADDLWIAEKFQSNSEIAGSPRNSFRASLEEAITGGKALISQGVEKITDTSQTKNAGELNSGGSLCEISFTVERETAQTYS